MPSIGSRRLHHSQAGNALVLLLGDPGGRSVPTPAQLWLDTGRTAETARQAPEGRQEAVPMQDPDISAGHRMGVRWAADNAANAVAALVTLVGREDDATPPACRPPRHRDASGNYRVRAWKNSSPPSLLSGLEVTVCTSARYFKVE